MILGYQQRVFEAAGNAGDGGRYGMHGVQFKVTEIDKPEVVCSATDGRVMIQWDLQLEEGEDYFPPTSLDAAAIKAGWGTGKGPRSIRFDSARSEWILTNPKGAKSIIPEVGSDFPNVADDRLVPDQEGAVMVAFSPALLSKLVRATKADRVQLSICRKDVAHGSARSVLVVRLSELPDSARAAPECPGVRRAILMPVRVD